jgi:hypothetical protein
MAWPSGSKAGTTHVDNGNDLLRNARADIKQNIDNVNDIIDEFNISSPSDGDLLQYSSSSGKWEQVASSSVGSAAGQQAVIKADATNLNLDSAGTRTSGTFLFEMSEIYDDAGFISFSNNQFNLTAATYWFEINSSINHGGQDSFILRNVTDGENTVEFNPDQASAVTEESAIITLTGTKTFQFQITVDDNFTTSGQAFIRISKYG